MRTQFLGNDVWNQLDRLAVVANKTLAVAYVTDAGAFRFSKGDTVIANATAKAIRSGQTSAALLRDAAVAGANIYSHSNLHAKIVLTPRVVIIGSANISTSSRRLNEAAVISSDPKVLQDTRRYVEILRRQAKRLLVPDLDRLAKLPVVREYAYGKKSGYPKPSLLEAIRANSHLLDDVAFLWYCIGRQLPRRIVQEYARRRGIPLPSGGRWEWYESPFSAKGLEAIRQHQLDCPLVAWETDMNKDKSTPTRFKSHNGIAVNCIDAFKLKNRLIQVVGTNSFRTPFRLRSERRELARILTVGLNKDLRLLGAIASHPAGILTRQQLRRLYELGTNTSVLRAGK